jgi:hypothetical protein
MTASVTIDCSSISAPNVVISDDPTGTYVLLFEGLGRPAITWRLTSAPDSVNVHGTEYVAAVKEQTSLPLKVMVQAASSAALDTAVTALEDALSQFTYPTTVAVDGVSKVWSCAPAAYSPTSGLVDASMVAQHFDVYTITIPVYPIPGSA